MSNSVNPKSFDLMSLEISPIKKPVYTNFERNESTESSIKVCDNEAVKNSDSNLNKVKKVHVKSRYKALFSNNVKNVSNSCRNTVNSSANKENIAVKPVVAKAKCVPATKTALGVNNRLATRIPLKSRVVKPAPKKIENPVPILKKVVKNKEINNEKPLSGKKETISTVDEILSDKIKYPKYQNSVDMAYSKYLQSLLLKEYLSTVEMKQENNYREYFEKFDLENAELLSTITVLQLFHQLHKRVVNLSYTHEKMHKISCDQLECLKKLYNKLKFCENLVEVDDRLIVEENCLDHFSSISERLNLEKELVGTDVVERFADLDQKLKNVNDLVKLQSAEMKTLEDVAVTVFEDIVMNVHDNVV